MQRTYDAERCGHPADLVGECHLDRSRLPRFSTLLKRHPRISLDDRIVGGMIRRAALGREAANRAVHDFGIGAADVGIADPEAFGDAGPVVLDESISAG